MPSLAWEIDIWGKFRSANLAARAELFATEANYKAMQIELISAISNTYFLLLDYRERLEISKRTLATRDSSLAIMQMRFDKGVIPEIDLNQAQIQRSIAAAAIPFYTRMVANTQYGLSVLLGQYPNAIKTGAGIMEMNPELEIPSGMPASLLERRPDIIAARETAAAQNARIGVAIAQRLPAISLTGTMGLASSQLSSLTGDGLAWAAGASLLSPLFEFNKNKRRVDIEKARAEQALYMYRQAALTAFKEVENALVEIETRKQELEAYKQQVKAAVNAERLSRMRYDRGATSYLELLEAQRNSFNAQLQLAQNTQALLNAYVNLYKALGGGWISAEEEQNANQQGQ
jgi:multidrug efflux system outer membrane protein